MTSMITRIITITHAPMIMPITQASSDLPVAPSSGLAVVTGVALEVVVTEAGGGEGGVTAS